MIVHTCIRLLQSRKSDRYYPKNRHRPLSGPSNVGLSVITRMNINIHERRVIINYKNEYKYTGFLGLLGLRERSLLGVREGY